MCDLSESVIYQEIFQKGFQKGYQEGLEEGRHTARAKFLLRVLERCVGPLSSKAHSQFELLLLDQPQINALFEAMPNFTSEKEVTGWIKHNATSKPRRNKPLLSIQSANKNGFASAKKKSN